MCDIARDSIDKISEALVPIGVCSEVTSDLDSSIREIEAVQQKLGQHKWTVIKDGDAEVGRDISFEGIEELAYRQASKETCCYGARELARTIFCSKWCANGVIYGLAASGVFLFTYIMAKNLVSNPESS